MIDHSGQARFEGLLFEERIKASNIDQLSLISELEIVDGYAAYMGHTAVTGDEITVSHHTDIFDEEITPPEVVRQSLATLLPEDIRSQLGVYNTDVVDALIVIVQAERKIDPISTDRDVHLAIRKAIETEDANPILTEVAKLSDLLLIGGKQEAHYPF